MKIVDLNQLSVAPLGTAYAKIKNEAVDFNSFSVITQTHNGEFCGVLKLLPDYYFTRRTNDGYVPTCSATIDAHPHDYNPGQLFVIFEECELRDMISALKYAAGVD